MRVKLETPSRRALIFRYEHAFVGGDVIPLELVAGIVAGIVRRWANRAEMAQTPWGIPVLVGEARVLGHFLAGRRRIAKVAAGISDIAGKHGLPFAVSVPWGVERDWKSSPPGLREEIAIHHFDDQRGAGAYRNRRQDGTTGYQHFPGDVVNAL